LGACSRFNVIIFLELCRIVQYNRSTQNQMNSKPRLPQHPSLHPQRLRTGGGFSTRAASHVFKDRSSSFSLAFTLIDVQSRPSPPHLYSHSASLHSPRRQIPKLTSVSALRGVIDRVVQGTKAPFSRLGSRSKCFADLTREHEKFSHHKYSVRNLTSRRGASCQLCSLPSTANPQPP